MKNLRHLLAILLTLSLTSGMLLAAEGKEKRSKRDKKEQPENGEEAEKREKRRREKREKKKNEPAFMAKVPDSGLTEDMTFEPFKNFEGAVIEAKSGYAIGFRYKTMTPNKDSVKKYPLFIVFHGMGRIGKDNKRQVPQGLPLVAELEELKVNAIVVQPQTAAGWAGKMEDGSKPVLSAVVEMIEHFIAEKSADPDRVYILGNSMGCGGVYNMVFDYPEYLAAAVPVVGGSLHERAAEMKKLPLWMFSAEKDMKSRAENCRSMLASLKELGHTNVKHTHYEDRSHGDTFSSMFERDNVAAWLLKQKRSKSIATK
jgi:predicted peptidase